MHEMTGIGLKALEKKVRAFLDLARERMRRITRTDAGTMEADIKVHHHLKRFACSLRRVGKGGCVFRVIDSDNQVRHAGVQGHQPLHRKSRYNGRGEENVADTFGPQHFRLPQFGTTDADGPRRQLGTRNFCAFVRFGVWAQRQAMPATMGCHAGNVGGQC